MKALLEINIETEPKGSIFLNSVNSQEAIIIYMLENGLIDIDKFKKEIEIFKIGFPDDKVTKFSELALNKYLSSKTTSKTPPPHFTRAFITDQLQKLYTGLTTGGFLPTDKTGADYKAFCYIFGKGKVDDFKPLMWIKSNSTTHDKIINKKSLLDLLSLLKIPYTEITDKSLLNKLFINPDGKSIKFTPSNYAGTQINFNSEYHNLLQQIVSTI